MKFSAVIILAFYHFSAIGQSYSVYKKVPTKFTFASAYKSNYINTRSSFVKNISSSLACGSNYGCANVMLSVSELQFNCDRFSETEVQLNWTTSEEINNFGFEIQRKVGPSNDFSKIGFVNAIEQQNKKNEYEFIDQNLANETSYYRLKIIANSGKYTFSKIISVSGFNQSLALKVIQNPIMGDEISFRIFGLKANENVDLVIYDMIGRKLFETSQLVTKTNAIIKFPKNDPFKVGRYCVRASINNKILQNNFVIAQ